MCHWSSDWVLFRHLKNAHTNKNDPNNNEMCAVFDYIAVELCLENDSEHKMTGLAFYMAAVCEREREHVPLLGPSVDRRTLALLTRLANSDTVSSLVCFACGQVHTHVQSWTQMYHDRRENSAYQSWTSRSAIRYLRVEDGLMRLLQKDATSFEGNFDLNVFKQRYATAPASEGSPFDDAKDLRSGNYELQRVLTCTPARPTLLGCLEDVLRVVRRGGQSCTRHGDHELCQNCEIPLCANCEGAIRRSGKDAGIPMSLCNDNLLVTAPS